ncbi:murein hydrolase activator EnvC family protein [Novosphingobium pokkalii]|uniref:Murein hydrolase activator EnvC family protein n=1 Tax=Novosphingobium pokkalii TaxID=1770194 RepID=A0ABV7V0L6_9SPHN|nr:peptidoglycan DD-metalloendopeptidase family protein [Novosphingobium pokkalii]GHC84862.1 peptidase M23 [Novosphingobium pokkalii]
MDARRSLALAAALLLPLAAWQIAGADPAPAYRTAGEAAAALAQAQGALAQARARGEKLEAQAQAATAAADRTAQEAAAIAARIQQSEAEIRISEARIALIDKERADLRLRMAARQEPLVRLTAALQLFARRPLAFSLLRAESLRDTVYLRAVLETMVPEVRRRTATLRSAIVRGRLLQEQARGEAARLRASQSGLGERRQQLAALESRQRIASRAASGTASREADHALALAEQTRDLATLMQQLGRDGQMRDALAGLPGPLQRPDRPGAVLMVEDVDPLLRTSAQLMWILPVSGRVVTGFGEAGATGPAQGLTIAPAPSAQIVAPAAGRVAFAGTYRGYGQIVIVEHPGGWTSLVTGLGRIDAAVGDRVVQGSPLGIAAPASPLVSVELRKDGVPVNPLAALRN